MLNEMITPQDKGNTICQDAETTHLMTQQSDP
jgi:hypothetical protein